MTIAVPNYFLERKESSLIKINSRLYIKHTKNYPHKISVRNTMHGMLLVLSGSKKVQTNEKEFELNAHQAGFFTQGNYFMSENDPAYHAIAIYFDDTFVSNLVKKYTLDLSGTSKNIVIIPYKENVVLGVLIDSIEKCIDESNIYQRELLELKIETLFLELLQLDSVKMKAFFQHILSTSSERMRYTLEENLDMIEKVEDMYRLMRMSSSLFHKTFFTIFKTSPKSWLDEQRMKKAAFLLISTQKSIMNVATECGYTTASWFIVQFKKYYNMTPKQYRVKNQH